jgi:hypothetical protein
MSYHARKWFAALGPWAGRPAVVFLVLGLAVGRAWPDPSITNSSPAALKIDLADPTVMTGTFYEIGSHREKILFKYRRQATRDGNLIHVEQSFSLPDGQLVCRESILYRQDQLVSYAMLDLRAKSQGSILIEPTPKDPRTQRLQLAFIPGGADGSKVHKATEILQPNTLICDTIYPYILAHWDDLLQGKSVKFRLVSLDPAGTFNFRLIKDSESTWQSRPVVGIKMEPANFILAHWIHPIFFTIEKAAPHRAFSYIGRTSPRIKVGDAWKFADAEAVFDWP